MSDAAKRIFVAIDTIDTAAARTLVAKLAGQVGGIKLGMTFFNANGPQGVRQVAAGQPDRRAAPASGRPGQRRGGAPIATPAPAPSVGRRIPLFLDLKFHDIPNTVAGAVEAVAPLEPAMLTVHAAGGAAMLKAAVEAAAAAPSKPKIIAVTVLTSLDENDLSAIGMHGSLADQVVRLARLAQDQGCHGVVCSPREVAAVRRACGPDFTLVVPGIRPVLGSLGDQKRVSSPAAAIADGADFLVIGRPITGAPDPAAAARAMAAQIASA